MNISRVAVVGTGTAGAQASWQLARRGVRVDAFETHAPGHGRAAAGGESRLFRTIELGDLRAQEMTDRANVLWDELTAACGRELRTRAGVLLSGASTDPQLDRAAENAATAGVAHEVLDVTDLRRRFPGIRHEDGDVGVWDVGGGYVRPELTVLMAARFAEAAGAVVHRGIRALAVEQLQDGVLLRTTTGERVYDRVLVAAGAWTPRLLPVLADRLVVRRLISAWFLRLEDVSVPPFLRPPSTYCYGIPTSDGSAVKIGLGFPDHLPVDDPDTVPRTTRPEELDPFRAVVERYLPGFDRDPYRVETYLETYTPTRREFLGPVPGLPDVIVATGFSGHGFRIAPAVGEAAAQLLLGERTTVDVRHLAVNLDPVP